LFGLGNHLRCDNLLSVAFHVLAYEFEVPIPSAHIFKEQDLNSVRYCRGLVIFFQMMVSKDFAADCFQKNWVELVGNTDLSITSNFNAKRSW
jgi:hypothetical protein